MQTAARKSPYADSIRETLAKQGLIGRYDPRHIEAYMRLEHSTLDGLAAWQFDQEVATAAACIDAGGTNEAEALAESYGF